VEEAVGDCKGMCRQRSVEGKEGLRGSSSSHGALLQQGQVRPQPWCSPAAAGARNAALSAFGYRRPNPAAADSSLACFW
jgi:hypothetical protein